MPEERLDPTAILAALGIPAPTSATPVLGGVDTAIWRIERADGDAALRVFRPDQTATCRREMAAMRAAAEIGVPVPRVLAQGITGGRPVLLLSWMPGRPLIDKLAAHPTGAWSLGRAFGRMQAMIHTAPVPALLRTHPVSWIEWAEPDEALRARLRAAAGPDTLVHLDFHPLNVLVEDGRVSAVLDWANARAGDRRADLARTGAILRFGPIQAVVPASIAAATRRTLIAGWRRGYRDIAGRITDMAPFDVWASRVMVRDLTPRLGRPDLPWLTDALLAHIDAWGRSRWQRMERGD